MKKQILISLVLMFVILSAYQVSVFATTDLNQYTTTENTLQNSELVQMQTETEQEIQKYKELYGSEAYGYTAYILNLIRLYSIPLCFIGIAVGSIYQYVIGIRKLDVRDRGFGLIIGFVTVFVILQILPLVFAIVVQGWRG